MHLVGSAKQTICYLCNQLHLKFFHSPPNFAIVNFLNEKNEKTEEQEIIPMSWIINGKSPKCYWPNQQLDLSRRQLDNLVSTESIPNDKDYSLHPVRILYDSCTITDARKKFESLANKSTAEENPEIDESGTDDSEDNGHESSEDSDSILKRKVAKKPEQKGKKKAKNDLNSSFEFSMYDHGIDGLNFEDLGLPPSNSSISMANVSKTSQSGKSLRDMSSQSKVSVSSRTREAKSSPRTDLVSHSASERPVARNLFNKETHGTSQGDMRVQSTVSASSRKREGTKSSPGTGFKSQSASKTPRAINLFNKETPGPDYVTREEFEVFERKLFHKMNVLQQMIVDLSSKPSQSSARELIKFPSSISEKVKLPAYDIKSLETLDTILGEQSVQEELATYLSQLGGKKHSDFLGRCLPKVISDEVCCITNWSGSEIPPGSKDVEGNVITREFKKTFSNLSNIVVMFCTASRMVCQTTTDKQVENYIQKWLLAYKDRLTPRKHVSATVTSRSKKSPKKRKRTA